jgi:hypothetical protein
MNRNDLAVNSKQRSFAEIKRRKERQSANPKQLQNVSTSSESQ